MIIVTGGVTANLETIPALRDACLAHSGRSRLEPGCLEHSLLADAENPLRLFFFERWTDAGALKAHLLTSDLAEFVREAKRLAVAVEKTLFYDASLRSRASVDCG